MEALESLERDHGALDKSIQKSCGSFRYGVTGSHKAAELFLDINMMDNKA
jgi:hypothetical protein